MKQINFVVSVPEQKLYGFHEAMALVGVAVTTVSVSNGETHEPAKPPRYKVPRIGRSLNVQLRVKHLQWREAPGTKIQKVYETICDLRSENAIVARSNLAAEVLTRMPELGSTGSFSWVISTLIKDGYLEVIE